MSDSEYNEQQTNREKVYAVVEACIKLRDYYTSKITKLEEQIYTMHLELESLKAYRTHMQDICKDSKKLLALYQEVKGFEQDAMREASNEYEDAMRDINGTTDTE
jgi:hypothetical protein